MLAMHIMHACNMSRWPPLKPPLTVIDSFLVVPMSVTVWESLRISRDDSIQAMSQFDWPPRRLASPTLTPRAPGILIKTHFPHVHYVHFYLKMVSLKVWSCSRVTKACGSCEVAQGIWTLYDTFLLLAPLWVQFLGRDLASPVQPTVISPALLAFAPFRTFPQV